MNIIAVMTALQKISARFMDMGADSDNIHVSMFTGHGGRPVVRARTTIGGILVTMDVITD